MLRFSMILSGFLTLPLFAYNNREIRLIEGNEKCRNLQNIDLFRGIAAGVYLFEAQNTNSPPPLHTLYVYTVNLFTQGRGGGEGES